MTANVSPVHSPTGGLDAQPSDDESWTFMGTPPPGPRSDSSAAFLRSPAHSLGSYVLLNGYGHHHGLSPSPSSLSLSPGPLQMALASSPPPPPRSAASPSLLSSQVLQAQRQPTSFPMQFAHDMAASLGSTASLGALDVLADGQYFVSSSIPNATPSQDQAFDMYLPDQQIREFMPDILSTMQAPALLANYNVLQQQQQQQSQLQPQLSHPAGIDIPLVMQSPANRSPWSPVAVLDQGTPPMFVMDGYAMPSPSPPSSFASVSFSPPQSASMHMPADTYPKQESPPQQMPQLQDFQLQQYFQQQDHLLQQHFQQFQQFQPQQPQPSLQNMHLQQGQPVAQAQVHASPPSTLTRTTKQTAAMPVSAKPSVSKSPSNSIKKVRGAGTRVEKRRPASNSSASEKLGTSLNSNASDDKFFIVTPTTINAHVSNGGRGNLFECMEAMQATQKGRKGPLADEIKESALQVRRVGACFCCHARKVRCDTQRPCKNCVRLCTAVPAQMCWTFEDFLRELFPAVIREHFRKDEMSKYMSESIDTFIMDGAERSHTVYLTAGHAFRSRLEIRNAKLFAAKTHKVLHHERLTTSNDQMYIKAYISAPLALDLSEASSVDSVQQQEKIKKSWRVYIQSLINEEPYVDQVTAAIGQSSLPRKLLTVARRFYMKTNAPIVKQTLIIYTMHYVMSHHISLSPETIQKLAHTGLVPQDDMFLTSRLLNRQIKALLDEIMQEEVDKLFKMFARELKPKSRMSWAPCVLAFLVFCLFMESIGLALDHFVTVHAQESLQEPAQKPHYDRVEAVKLSRAIENMPFRQFAMQFHNIYQTHPSDVPGTSSAPLPSSSGSSSSSTASTSSAAALAAKGSFNPLLDDSPLVSGDLDGPSLEMVSSLRELLNTDSCRELDLLSHDDSLDGSVERYAYPRDVSFNYTGRLCSKFMLSFMDKDKINTPQSPESPHAY